MIIKVSGRVPQVNQYLNNPDTVPPRAWPEQSEQGFAYKDPNTGRVIVAPSWKELPQKVRRFNETNNFPVGLEFEQQIQNQLCGRLPPEFCSQLDPNRTAEMPREDWPFWAKGFALLSTPEDRGVGSTIERLIGPVNSAQFKAWHLSVFGVGCGCSERRESYDAQFPYH